MPIEEHHDSLKLYSYGMRRACSTHIDRYHPAIVVKSCEGEASRPSDPVKLAHWVADRVHQQELYRRHLGVCDAPSKRNVPTPLEFHPHTSDLTGLERRLKHLGMPPEGTPERDAYLRETMADQLAREPNNPVIARMTQAAGVKPAPLKPAMAVVRLKPAAVRNFDDGEIRRLSCVSPSCKNSIDVLIAVEIERGRKFLAGSPKTRLHQLRLRDLPRIKAVMSTKAQPVTKIPPQRVSKSQLPTQIEMNLSKWIPERAEPSSARLPDNAPSRTTLDDTYGAQDDGETRRLRRLAQPAVTPSEKLQRTADLDLHAKLADQALKQQTRKVDSDETSKASKSCAQPNPTASTAVKATPETKLDESPASRKKAGPDPAGLLILGFYFGFPLAMLVLIGGARMIVWLYALGILLVFGACKIVAAELRKPRRNPQSPVRPSPSLPQPVRRGQLTTPPQRARFLANEMTYDELVAAWKAEKRPSMKEYYQCQIDYLNDHNEEP